MSASAWRPRPSSAGWLPPAREWTSTPAPSPRRSPQSTSRLATSERQLPRILDIYRPRQQAMIDALAVHLPEDFAYTRPEGGMFIWVEGPRGFDAEALQRRILERGVAFVPGKYFYVNPEGKQNTFRMNFTAADPATIERAIAIVGDAIAEELAASR
ncbi:MAG: aminotransferase class I/II-fold pyridoxal phosphate-dependent enzyme [Dehalococcoidia bacterium]|nr:aminotransferase class I/II-fold pyridoxal phosphate-dependent enzyme [Dehalococcoidia bacterium]